MAKDALPDIAYPALLWREGYMYLAQTPLELCAHPRSLFEDTVRHARAGEWHLIEAGGRCFDVADWVRIRPFGGITGIALRLIFSVFAAPVLANETKLPLKDFKQKLARAVAGRYHYDTDKAPAVAAVQKLKAADSYQAAMAALPKR